MQFLHLSLVMLGGGIGAVTRFLVGQVVPTVICGIPFPILLINIIGCFLMGIITELLEYIPASYNLRIFIITGFLGGFTTFSSFALEFGSLYEKKSYEKAIIYVALSVIVSLFGFFLGRKLGNILT